MTQSVTPAADFATEILERTCCFGELNIRDDNGDEVKVFVKVKLNKEQLRSGTFQKEPEEVDMTLNDFKKHFTRCAKKYLKHHINDIMSSQARRNLYEKMIDLQL